MVVALEAMWVLTAYNTQYFYVKSVMQYIAFASKIADVSRVPAEPSNSSLPQTKYCPANKKVQITNSDQPLNSYKEYKK